MIYDVGRTLKTLVELQYDLQLIQCLTFFAVALSFAASLWLNHRYHNKLVDAFEERERELSTRMLFVERRMVKLSENIDDMHGRLTADVVESMEEKA